MPDREKTAGMLLDELAAFARAAARGGQGAEEPVGDLRRGAGRQDSGLCAWRARSSARPGLTCPEIGRLRYSAARCSGRKLVVIQTIVVGFVPAAEVRIWPR